jgi:hypothetical protein
MAELSNVTKYSKLSCSNPIVIQKVLELDNIITKKDKNIMGKQELLLVSLDKYYKINNNKNILINILGGEKRISLRIIDWFVTNYSKKYNIEYIIKNRHISPKRGTLKKKYNTSKKTQINDRKYIQENRTINVYLHYKSQLRAYSKKQFDPFCRRNRINFYFNEEEYITTTVGQLNFFRWALQNNVIDYIVKNYEGIEKDMNINTKKHKLELQLNLDLKQVITNEKKISEKKDRKKRKPLSIAITNNMNKSNNRVLLNFD